MYDFLSNDKDENLEVAYSSYTLLNKGKVREEAPIPQMSWEEFQDYCVFMKAKNELHNDMSGSGSVSGF